MNAILDQIKEISARHHIPVFGIADSSPLETAPAGHRPSDLLPGAARVVCLGAPFPRGVFRCGARANQTYWRAAAIYYRTFDAIILQVARIIEGTGATAVPVFGCFPYDLKAKGDFWGFMSLVKMAEAAGLGQTGKNGLLFNSTYGPRLLLGGLVTTAALPETAWPARDEAGCPEDCHVCQEACPAQAIDPDGNVDRVACVKQSMKSPLFSRLMSTGTKNSAEAELINLVTGVDDHSMYTCIKCVAMCPRL
jgi:epoxyqueuosine reductase QueG